MKPSNKEALKRASRKFIETHPERSMFYRSRQRARKEGLEFTITIEDIIIPDYCPYLGCELTNIQGKGRIWTNASLDRIDSSKGYIPSNIQVISMRANLMKGNATRVQLLNFAEGIDRIYKDWYNTL